jgi:NodT family efflux transporter outer membrane factor (OMF) lipoprotein
MPSSRSRRRAVGAAMAAMALTGCTVGPDFQRPALPSTPGYGAVADAPADARVRIGGEVAQAWWQAFRSPTLDALMRQALVDNPTLQSADASLAEARAQLAAARGRQLPQADLSAGVEQERLNFATLGFNAAALPGFSNNPQISIYSVGATVSYALDVFGEQRRGVESARAEAEARSHQLDAAYLTLTGQIATQAALIAALNAEIGQVDAILDNDKHDIALVRSAQRAGGVAEEARVNASAQIAADAALLPPLEQQRAEARHMLTLLMGQAPGAYAPPDFTLAALPLPADVPISVPSALVRQRPDILQAEAELHAATAEIGVETAKLYPNINLTAALTQSALQPQNIFDWPATAYTLGAGLTQPLYHGGQVKAQRRAAVETARARAADYQETVLDAFRQVADLLDALAHDRAAIAAQTHTLSTAQASLNLDQTAYRLGGQGLLPVVDAQRQVNAAALHLTQAQAALYLHTVQLFVATGRGWDTPKS